MINLQLHIFIIKFYAKEHLLYYQIDNNSKDIIVVFYFKILMIVIIAFKLLIDENNYFIWLFCYIYYNITFKFFQITN